MCFFYKANQLVDNQANIKRDFYSDVYTILNRI